MKIQTVWTADLKDKEEKDQFKKDVHVWINTAVGSKFKSILEQQLLALNVGEVKIENYESPNWANKQAHLNGYRQHIYQMLALLEVKSEFE